MGQEQVVDAGGVEAEVGGIVLLDLMAALVQAAVDQDAGALDLQQVAGAGDLLCGPVKGKFHCVCSPGPEGG